MKTLVIIALLPLSLLLSCGKTNNTIAPGKKLTVSTYAGLSGIAGFRDGPARSAQFTNLRYIIFKPFSNNLYIADSDNELIRRIDGAAYTISTFSGTPQVVGYKNGLTLAAEYNNPIGLAFDSKGNLFVADQRNQVIRKIGYQDFVAVTYAGIPNAPGYADGPVSSAQFSYPTWLAFDSADNLYVVDDGNYRIRKISPDGVVSTFAGNGHGYQDGPVASAKFSSIGQMAFDKRGNLFVTDGNGNAIRKVTPDGIVSTFLQRGLLQYPYGLAIDNQDNIYVSDTKSNSIYKITKQGEASIYAGINTPGSVDGYPLTAGFNSPTCLALDADGNLYIADTGNQVVRKIGLQ